MIFMALLKHLVWYICSTHQAQDFTKQTVLFHCDISEPPSNVKGHNMNYKTLLALRPLQ